MRKRRRGDGKMERKISSESRRTILNLGLNWGG
jgi:hypothetical protein